MEIYGFDLVKEADLTKNRTMISAAAQAALDRYSVVPLKNTTWKQASQYKQAPQSDFEKQKEYFAIKEKEMTNELKAELMAVQLRHTTHKNAFQVDEKLDTKVQFGRIIEGPSQFYSQRLKRKDRKNSMVDQLLDNNDDKMRAKLQEMHAREKEERITRYKTQVQTGRKGRKHQKDAKK
ncbi:Fcf2_pre-rRNA processing protein [Hexamita inflata]|uniref:Fcf2 pre-rRNA processing protein n=1 Tax=Hexamita inflata TaxID=28002 RepID=A0AA86NYJ2_9EUKA|nr:Fcf2 pre-rRNA processing protein [Hexamita inflata]